MIIPIVKVGNSRGLRLPKSLLEQYQIGKEIDLHSVKEGLLLKPVRNKPRKDWEKKFQEMAAHEDDKLLMPDFTNSTDKDWQW